MIKRLLRIIYPPKCLLCRKVLDKQETDLCRTCREQVPAFPPAKKKISFVAGWTALWYYKGNVRNSLLRYKFARVRSYAGTYGRLLSMRLTDDAMTDFDILTWVPISKQRLRVRGFDQVELLAYALGKQLQVAPVATLRKHRHTPTQSGIKTAAERRANVLGAYHVIHPEMLVGKRILLLDDIITTGATLSECARVLLTAGAKEVICAAIAASEYK